MITANAPEAEILKAINEKGLHRYYWRRYDFAEENEKNLHSWVIPRDIGRSKRKDTALKRRLNALVAEGKLEKRYQSRMPRYRVVR